MEVLRQPSGDVANDLDAQTCTASPRLDVAPDDDSDASRFSTLAFLGGATVPLISGRVTSSCPLSCIILSAWLFSLYDSTG